MPYSMRPLILFLWTCKMPEMGGIKAVELLRERERKSGQHTPVIAMTAHAMQGDRERCLTAGMDDYLSKPIQAHSLFNAIERTLRHESMSATPSPETPEEQMDSCNDNPCDPTPANMIFDREMLLEQLAMTMNSSPKSSNFFWLI